MALSLKSLWKFLLWIQRGTPVNILSDDGPKFITQNLWDWMAANY
jgi:hypothetical protein